jgi:hypothetical protein
MERLAEHALGTSSQREQRAEQFEASDIPMDLARRELGARARQTFDRLNGEHKLLERAAAWFDRNLDAALQGLLSFGGNGVQGLMLDVRRELRRRNRELVLLVEGLAKMQGLDRQVIDALIQQPGRGDELCIQRSVMAVTPGYYLNILDTVRDRINACSLGEAGAGAAGPNPGEVAAFAARCLNAVRLGDARIRRWYEGTPPVGGARSPLESACANCADRAVCHRAFGKVGGYGLYPFNARAVDEMHRSLRQRDADAGTRNRSIRYRLNPRVLVDGVLRHVLSTALQELPEGGFPSRSLLTRCGGATMTAVPTQALRSQAGTEFERYRTLLELWGDPEDLRSVDAGIVERFGMKPLGPGGPTPPPPAPPPDIRAAPAVAATVAPTAVTVASDSVLDALDQWGNGVALSPWVAGRLREAIYPQLVAAVDWDAERLLEGFHVGGSARHAIRQEAVVFCLGLPRSRRTRACLKLPLPPRGASEALHAVMVAERPEDEERLRGKLSDAERRRFEEELARTAYALRGLWLAQKEGGRFDFPDGRRYLAHWSECLAELAEEAARQARRVPGEPEGFDPVPMAAETLLLGARMAGRLTRRDPSDREMMDALFSDFGSVAEPDNSPRARSWCNLLAAVAQKATGASESRPGAVEVLRARVGCTKGGSTGIRVVDAAALLPVFRRVRRDWCASSEVPSAGLHPAYTGLAQLHGQMGRELEAAARAEAQNQCAWARDIRAKGGSATRAQLCDALREVAREASELGLWPAGSPSPPATSTHGARTWGARPSTATCASSRPSTPPRPTPPSSTSPQTAAMATWPPSGGSSTTWSASSGSFGRA